MVKRAQQGFTYLTVMFVVAILLGGLALVGETWETSARREKETELLFIGNQYRRAIGLFYEATPGGVKRYPRALEDLVKDPRQPSTQRYLRKLFPDPMTGKEWTIIRGADGGVQGVYSPSEVTPLKIAGFRVRDASFEGAQKYSDWKFIHTPAGAAAAGKPAAKPAADGTKPAADGTKPAADGTAPAAATPAAKGAEPSPKDNR
jgi:type II secretory pathway pseudopilin PulG